MKSRLKKAGVIILALTLSLAIVACGGEEQDDANDTDEPVVEGTEEDKEATEEEVEEIETGEEDQESDISSEEGQVEDYTEKLKAVC